MRQLRRSGRHGALQVYCGLFVHRHLTVSDSIGLYLVLELFAQGASPVIPSTAPVCGAFGFCAGYIWYSSSFIELNALTSVCRSSPFVT